MSSLHFLWISIVSLKMPYFASRIRCSLSLAVERMTVPGGVISTCGESIVLNTWSSIAHHDLPELLRETFARLPHLVLRLPLRLFASV